MERFSLSIPEDQLDDLRTRLARTRWPDATAEQPGWERGIPQHYLRELADYWLHHYDWRKAEEQINAFPQFRTEIDGATVHFVHVRSADPDAVPLLITHGWPGAFTEFLHLIGPLTDPVGHGAPQGTPAFHVVLPSIPGFGFSGPLREHGWGTHRVALAWASLMRELGYEHYIAQGGDAGSVISMTLGAVAPEHVLGVHVNMLMTVPPPDGSGLADLSESDQARLARLGRFDTELSGYMKLQSSRPRTLSYALADSPVGQLAWIAERFRDWTDSRQVPEDAVSRDQLLTIVTIYWLTASAGSSAQLYYEDAEGLRLAAAGHAGPPLPVPLGVAVFPHDIFVPIRSIAQMRYPSLVHWTEFDRGGHFAALERPGDLITDIRAFATALPD